MLEETRFEELNWDDEDMLQLIDDWGSLNELDVDLTMLEDERRTLLEDEILVGLDESKFEEEMGILLLGAEYWKLELDELISCFEQTEETLWWEELNSFDGKMMPLLDELDEVLGKLELDDNDEYLQLDLSFILE